LKLDLHNQLSKKFRTLSTSLPDPLHPGRCSSAGDPCGWQVLLKSRQEDATAELSDSTNLVPSFAASPRPLSQRMNLGMPEMIFLFVLALIIFGLESSRRSGGKSARAQRIQACLNEFQSRSKLKSRISKGNDSQISPKPRSSRRCRYWRTG
jgi:hypothetical protein